MPDFLLLIISEHLFTYLLQHFILVFNPKIGDALCLPMISTARNVKKILA
jgi:hypothetical protein